MVTYGTSNLTCTHVFENVRNEIRSERFRRKLWETNVRRWGVPTPMVCRNLTHQNHKLLLLHISPLRNRFRITSAFTRTPHVKAARPWFIVVLSNWEPTLSHRTLLMGST